MVHAVRLVASMQPCVHCSGELRAACSVSVRNLRTELEGNRMSSTHPTVLIVSSDARFAAAVIERWQRAVVCPSNSGACSADFVSMAADVSSGGAISAYNIAIIGPLTAERLPPLLERFGRTERPVLVTGDDPCQAEVERATLANVIGIAQQGDWVGKAGLSLIHVLGGAGAEACAEPGGLIEGINHKPMIDELPPQQPFRLGVVASAGAPEPVMDLAMTTVCPEPLYGRVMRVEAESGMTRVTMAADELV